MKYERKFYTQVEAAEKLGRSSGDVYYLVKTEQLPVCFEARGEVFGVTIQHQDGSIEYLPKELAVPINGVLKSLLPPVEQDILQASSVQIIQVGDRQCRHVTGTELRTDGRPIPKLVADNSQIPTTNDPDKFVQPGFVVKGWVNFVDAQASDWLFHIDDLQALSEASAVAKPEPEKIKRKAAFVTESKVFWPSIETDISDAVRNGLHQVSKHDKHGFWKVEPALTWANQRGKLIKTKAQTFIESNKENPSASMLRILLDL
jgi:hypothetical protein